MSRPAVIEGEARDDEEHGADVAGLVGQRRGVKAGEAQQGQQVADAGHGHATGDAAELPQPAPEHGRPDKVSQARAHEGAEHLDRPAAQQEDEGPAGAAGGQPQLPERVVGRGVLDHV